MRTQATTFCDMKTLKPKYGFKVFHGGRWMTAGDNSGPFLFDTEADRDAKRKEVSAMKIPAPSNAEVSGAGTASAGLPG